MSYAIKKRWKLNPVDSQQVDELHQALGIDPLFCQLLIQRGISSPEAAQHFFHPNLNQLHDPFLMKDMAKAVERIEVALQGKEKILLYGDYDVDGTTSVAMLHHFLEKQQADLDYYLPDRYKEGYGVSHASIDYAKQNGIKLIIAMDCGIKAIEQVAKAKAQGIDFIICDHHLPDETLPDAIAVLNPKRLDCNYPYKALSGCGVAFKLAQAYVERKGLAWSQLEDLLDFTVISIACDIVPLTGENRVLAWAGLKRLNQYPKEGIKALLEEAQLKTPLNISQVVFGIGPMLNAAGRLHDARQAVRLLLAKNPVVAANEAYALHKSNQQRKSFDRQILAEAKDLFEALPDWKTRSSIVLYQKNWHKGVIGIVASRMVDKYHKPCIILTESEGQLVGSARSVAHYDIHQAIQICDSYLQNYGGHQFAAGLTLVPEQYESFAAHFEKVVQQSISATQRSPEINLSAVLSIEQVNHSFWQTLQSFAPFGPSNRNPVFASRGLEDSGYSRLLKNQHLKLSIKNGGNKPLQGIAFGLGHFIETIQEKRFDLCYTIEENTWNGRTELQLNVKDIRS